jgi:hypothetical protein
VTTDPEELDPEIDVELGGETGEDDDDLDGIPDGFVVEGEDDPVDDEDDGVDIDDDAAVSAPVEAVAVAAEDPDDFEEELAPLVRVPDEEDDAPARRAGEFICSRCFLVKRDSQLAVRSRKVCRDCA